MTPCEPAGEERGEGRERADVERRIIQCGQDAMPVPLHLYCVAYAYRPLVTTSSTACLRTAAIPRRSHATDNLPTQCPILPYAANEMCAGLTPHPRSHPHSRPSQLPLLPHHKVPDPILDTRRDEQQFLLWQCHLDSIVPPRFGLGIVEQLL